MRKAMGEGPGQFLIDRRPYVELFHKAWQAPPATSLHEAFTQPSVNEMIAAVGPVDIAGEMRRMAEAGSGSRGSGRAGSVIGSYRGVEIVADPNLTEYVEDWSDVRSPSRARRRRAQGHKQRIKLVPAPNMVTIGGRVHASPAAYQRLRQQLDDQLMTAVFGGGPDGRK